MDASRATPKSTITPKGYSIDDAAQAIGTSRATIYREVKAGKLELIKVRGRSLITVRSINRLFGEDQAA